jgi:hypothetical protein
MQVYVRLGIRLLYKVSRSSTTLLMRKLRLDLSGREREDGGQPGYMHLHASPQQCLTFCISARRLLKSLSIKQGIKYDDPESARDIPAFIEFHNLKVDEILDPLSSFSKWFALILMVKPADARFCSRNFQ